MNRMFGKICISLLFFGILRVRCTAAYRISERDGCIIVENTDTKTTETTEFRTSALPRTDRERLRQGIICQSRAELAARLEDLCS